MQDWPMVPPRIFQPVCRMSSNSKFLPELSSTETRRFGNPLLTNPFSRWHALYMHYVKQYSPEQ